MYPTTLAGPRGIHEDRTTRGSLHHVHPPHCQASIAQPKDNNKIPLYRILLSNKRANGNEKAKTHCGYALWRLFASGQIGWEVPISRANSDRRRNRPSDQRSAYEGGNRAVGVADATEETNTWTTSLIFRQAGAWERMAMVCGTSDSRCQLRNRVI